MSGEILSSAIFGLPLLLLGTVFFDAVHWVLHGMLRTRSRLLRTIAWPHAVHHRWLDRQLRNHPEDQRKNIWCHIVPEYLTQLAFCGALAVWLPIGAVATCALLQTGIFVLILRERGLDINHRAIEILDAYRPSMLCPPAYHALHHVYPDAHFSAYTKLVDWVVGGGTWLGGKRVRLQGGRSPFGRGLRAMLQGTGIGELAEISEPEPEALRAADILVLCDPADDEVRWVEAQIAAIGPRQLPPEVWVVHSRPDDPTASHYYRDVRVIYRTLVVPGAAELDLASAARRARRALFGIRRGFCYVPTRLGLQQIRDFRRFRATAPRRPDGAPRLRARAELAAA